MCGSPIEINGAYFQYGVLGQGERKDTIRTPGKSLATLLLIEIRKSGDIPTGQSICNLYSCSKHRDEVAIQPAQILNRPSPSCLGPPKFSRATTLPPKQFLCSRVCASARVHLYFLPCNKGILLAAGAVPGKASVFVYHLRRSLSSF